jgi:predicted ATP-grasp superfamily ATP-dependent carboligase
MYSRFCDYHVLPPIEEHSDAWLSLLEFLGDRLDNKGVLYPTTDPHLLFMSKHRDALGRHFHFIIPDASTVQNVINKRTQYAIAESAGISVPKTFYPESAADVRAWADQIPYPCILKPYSYKGRKSIGVKTVRATSARQLVEAYVRADETGQQFMVQELVPGESTSIFAYHGFWDHSGREVAWWTKQHLRGIRLADGSYHMTVDAPEVADLARQLLRAFSYKGCSHVEFKLDPRDQTFRLMEINARTGLSTQHGVAAGVDLPWIVYRYANGMSLKGQNGVKFKRGVTYVNEVLDFSAFLDYRRQGQLRLLPWLRSILGATTKAHWDRNDPCPFVAVVWNRGRRYLDRRVKSFTTPLLSKVKRAKPPAV